MAKKTITEVPGSFSKTYIMNSLTLNGRQRENRQNRLPWIVQWYREF